MKRRALLVFLVLLAMCKQRETASREAGSVCAVVTPQVQPLSYVPTVHAPWPFHGSEWEASLNHTRAIGKSSALLTLLGNDRVVITVRFLADTAGRMPAEAEIARIMSLANSWGQKGCLDFTRVKSGGLVRVRLTDSNVSMSSVGREAQALSRLEPTMVLGLHRTLLPHEYEWIVRHEFGHALGLVHEHQNATTSQAATICWNKDVVRQALGSYVDVDALFFQQFSGKAFTSRPYDSSSVMVYHAPPDWTCDHRGLPMNYQLSSDDDQTIADLYPAHGLRK